MANIGIAIRKLRKEHGLTQVKFAELMTVTQAYISQIETGKAEPTEMFLELMRYKLGNENLNI